MQKATRQHTKEHNRNLVLKTIFERTSTSRAEIARITKLTRATVSDLVAELIEEGLVDEIGTGSSQGGKSPTLLGIISNARYLIGLDLAHNQFSGAVVNLRGEIREMVTEPVKNRNGDEALKLVYQIADQLIQDDLQPVVGIGVGTPGLVNTRDGVVINAVNLDWENLPLAQLLEVRYHLPVHVLNDSQAAAMGEFTYGGGGKDRNNLVVISVRHGIGAGIVIGGRLFHGDGGGAGEIGHVVVVPDGGLPCHCGNRGCLETVASAQAVVRRVQTLTHRGTNPVLGGTPDEITLGAVEQAFASGDPQVRQVVLEAGYYMGLALSNLIGTLNIQKIVLSGDMTRFGAPWLAAIRETIASTTLPRLVQETQIEIGTLGGNQVIMGASALLLSNYSMLFSP